MAAKNKFTRNWGKWLSLSIAVVVLGGIWFLFRDRLDQETVMEFSERMPAFWVVVAFLILPLVGVPLRLMLILLGFRFGFVSGMMASALGLLFHSFAAYFIARGSFRDTVRNYLKRSGYGIPPIQAKHRLWITAVIAAVPGPPYIAKLYLLALTDLPLRIYAGIAAPIYIVLSVVPVGIGGAVVEFEEKWFYLAIFGFVIITVVGVWLQKRYSPDNMLKDEGEGKN